MNYNENPNITFEKDFAEKGYTKSYIKIKNKEKSQNEKRLEDFLRNINPSYQITHEDITLCNHPNFSDKNMLVMACSLLIINEYKTEGVKIGNVEENIINEYANLIYEFSENKYNRNFSEKETMNRLNFSILSYILLIEKTKKDLVQEYKKIISLSLMFLDGEKFEEYLEKQMNYNDITSNDTIQDEKLEYNYEPTNEYKFEGEFVEELLKTVVISENKDYKIIKFIYSGKYISIKTFFQEIMSNSFVNSFVNEIKNIEPYFGLEFIPFSYKDFEKKDLEIYIYKTSKNATKPNKYKKYLTDDKYAIVFRNNKEIVIVPTNVEKKVQGIYSNLSIFLNSAKTEQIQEFWRLLGKNVKSNIEKHKLCFITVNLESEDWLSIKISPDSRYNVFQDYINYVEL